MSRTRRRAAGLVAALVAVAPAIACRDGAGGGKGGASLRRSDDAGPPVVMVDQPSPGPGGRAPVGTAPRGPLEREREPNSDPETAGPLGPGVEGVLDGETDVDAFRFESTAVGVVAAQVTGVADVDLKLELRDDRFAVVATSDRAGAGVSEGLPDAPVGTGTYYLVVREVPHHKKKKSKKDKDPGRVGPSAPYQLTARMSTATAPRVSREPDDDAGAANPLALGESVTGYVGWSGDADVWKLPVGGLGEGDGLDLSVTAVDGVALTLEVTDSASRSLVSRTAATGEPVAIKALAPRLAEGEVAVYHVVVRGRPSNPDVAYTLQVDSRLLDLDEEAEPNDRTSRANELRYQDNDQGSMRGLLGPADVDIFHLSPSPSPTQLAVALDAPPGLDVAVELIAESGAALARADAGGPGVAESVGAAVPERTAVYVKVSAKNDRKAPRGVPYQLRWSLTDRAAPGPATVPGRDPDEDPLPPEE